MLVPLLDQPISDILNLFPKQLQKLHVTARMPLHGLQGVWPWEFVKCTFSFKSGSVNTFVECVWMLLAACPGLPSLCLPCFVFCLFIYVRNAYRYGVTVRSSTNALFVQYCTTSGSAHFWHPKLLHRAASKASARMPIHGLQRIWQWELVKSTFCYKSGSTHLWLPKLALGPNLRFGPYSMARFWHT